MLLIVRFYMRNYSSGYNLYLIIVTAVIKADMFIFKITVPLFCPDIFHKMESQEQSR